MRPRRNRKTFTLFLIVFSTFYGFGQTYLLTDFVETQLPKYGIGDLYDVTLSNHEFSVLNRDGKLIITRTIYKNDSTEFNLHNGKLLGTNYGEWGGTLKFLPNDRNKGELKIIDMNIIFIFQFNEYIYFIGGLAHLSGHSGSMYKLENFKDTFSCTKVIDFDYPPDAYALHKDTILVASGGNLILIKDSKREIIPNDGLSPNSMVFLDNKYVYMGIRGGYVKFNLTNQDRSFYLYKQD